MQLTRAYTQQPVKQAIISGGTYWARRAATHPLFVLMGNPFHVACRTTFCAPNFWVFFLFYLMNIFNGLTYRLPSNYFQNV